MCVYTQKDFTGESANPEIWICSDCPTIQWFFCQNAEWLCVCLCQTANTHIWDDLPDQGRTAHQSSFHFVIFHFFVICLTCLLPLHLHSLQRFPFILYHLPHCTIFISCLASFSCLQPLEFLSSSFSPLPHFDLILACSLISDSHSDSLLETLCISSDFLCLSVWMTHFTCSNLTY